MLQAFGADLQVFSEWEHAWFFVPEELLANPAGNCLQSQL